MRWPESPEPGSLRATRRSVRLPRRGAPPTRPRKCAFLERSKVLAALTVASTSPSPSARSSSVRSCGLMGRLRKSMAADCWLSASRSSRVAEFHENCGDAPAQSAGGRRSHRTSRSAGYAGPSMRIGISARRLTGSPTARAAPRLVGRPRAARAQPARKAARSNRCGRAGCTAALGGAAGSPEAAPYPTDRSAPLHERMRRRALDRNASIATPSNRPMAPGGPLISAASITSIESVASM